MIAPVNDTVSKAWAKQALEILTENYQDITSLFTKLLTMSNLEKQGLKTIVDKMRVDHASTTIIQCVRYGWAHGVNESQSRFTLPKIPRPYRRLRALLPLAIAAGKAIGEAQAKRMAGTGKAKVNRPAEDSLAGGHQPTSPALLIAPSRIK